METLDVACGFSPKGSINIDLNISKTLHRHGVSLNTKNISNFILADAHFLPFRNKIFDIVYSHHLLEHSGVSPNRVIKEMLRISKKKIEIRVPTIFGDKKDISHIRAFRKKHFLRIFRNFNVKIRYGIWQPFKRLFPFFAIPKEIIVEVWL